MVLAKFKIFLVKRGIKQYEVADACGWQESKVSNFANGRKVPNVQELEALAIVLDMPEERLRRECGW